MLGADLIGFQTYQSSQNFVRAVYAKLGLTCSIGRIEKDNRTITIDAVPMGIANEYFEDKAIINPFEDIQHRCLFPPYSCLDEEVNTADVDELLEMRGDRKWKLIVSSDRVDKSSDLAFHIQAYKYFLQANPEVVASQSVLLLLLVQPPLFEASGDAILKDEIDNLVSNINGMYNTLTWKPILYRYGHIKMIKLRKIFQYAEVCMSVPQKAGMGLLCKEYIASRKDSGVVILSENMGAANELCADALLVTTAGLEVVFVTFPSLFLITETSSTNPCDRRSVADAIKRALCMPPAEQQKRMASMKDRIRRVSGKKWAERFVNETLVANGLSRRSRTRLLAGLQYMSLVMQYRDVEGPRLIILDYDGTLVEMGKSLEDLGGDQQLVHILATLSSRDDTTVVINSGRSKESLDKCFGAFPELNKVNIAAEHGTWIRTDNAEWHKIITEDIDDSWKPKLLSRLENMYMHLQGVRVEEMDHGLVVVLDSPNEVPPFSVAGECGDSALSQERAREILRKYCDIVRYYLMNNSQVRVIESEHRLEVKSSLLSKGRAALNWIDEGSETKKWAFIMCIGDDFTDEDTFQELPETAFTIKVGLRATAARFYLMNTFYVRLLLQDLISRNQKSSES
ncbi:hypothetical protein ACOME3_002177 [Neoechinorhynchus agilis]